MDNDYSVHDILKKKKFSLKMSYSIKWPFHISILD